MLGDVSKVVGESLYRKLKEKICANMVAQGTRVRDDRDADQDTRPGRGITRRRKRVNSAWLPGAPGGGCLRAPAT